MSICKQCSHSNPAGSNFCESCGQQLQSVESEPAQRDSDAPQPVRSKVLTGGGWFTSDGQARQGPLSEEEINQAICSGPLKGSNLVWKKGINSWIRLNDFIHSEMPPPFPPRAFERAPHHGQVLASTVSSSTPPLPKFGGWLMFVGLILVIGPFLNLVGFAGAVSFAAQTQARPVWFAALCLIPLLAYNGLVLRKFFQRSPDFPRAFVVLSWLAVACQLIVTILCDTALSRFGIRFDAGADFFKIVGAAVAAFIWTLYMRRSKRVKATFFVS